MRVALISDSPTLPTGFARTSRGVVKALTSIGHEVSCYGFGVFRETFDPALSPYKIWPAGDNTAEAKAAFLHFLTSEKPDAILINYDLITTLGWLQFFANKAVRLAVVSLLIVDGLPVYSQILGGLSQCAAIITVTQCVQAHLTAVLSSPVYYFPHLVDGQKFRPLKDAEAVRRALFPNSLVVGTIAQNRRRKQLVQTIHAIRLLRDAGRNPVLLLHTDRIYGSPFGGNPLRKVVDYFGIADIVYLTESHNRVDAVADDAADPSSRFGPSLDFRQLPDLTVAERLNLCDVAVVASSFGGFEYGIIEAQACGVPVCVTDDSGIMMEVAGSACEPLRPSLFEFTEYGAQIWRVAPETIAAAISKIADDPARRRALQVSGVENVKRYDQTTNEAAFADLLGKILASLPGRVKPRAGTH